MSGITQGASLNWSANSIYQPGTTTPVDTGLAYLFLTAQNKDYGVTVTTVDAVKDLLSSGAEFYTDTDTGKNYIKKGDDKIQIAASGSTNNKGGLAGATGFNGSAFDNGDGLTAFVVVFDATNFADAKNFIVTSEKSASWTSSSGSKTMMFGSQANATWTPVPEPSTAALALAGLALLLKRRRA
jgi:hypothetical protein